MATMTDSEIDLLAALDDKRAKAAPGEWWEDQIITNDVHSGYRDSQVLFMPPHGREGAPVFDTLNAWHCFDPDDRYALGHWAVGWANQGRRLLDELTLLRRAREIALLAFPDAAAAFDVCIGTAEKERVAFALRCPANERALPSSPGVP